MNRWRRGGDTGDFDGVEGEDDVDATVVDDIDDGLDRDEEFGLCFTAEELRRASGVLTDPIFLISPSELLRVNITVFVLPAFILHQTTCTR